MLHRINIGSHLSIYTDFLITAKNTIGYRIEFGIFAYILEKNNDFARETDFASSTMLNRIKEFESKDISGREARRSYALH